MRTIHFPDDARVVTGGTVALTWVRTHDWDAENWRDRALCRDSNAELFFPIGSTGQALDMIEAAREICNECTAKAQCLEFALQTNQEAGIWGGSTEEERRAIRKMWAEEADREAATVSA
ncbi:MAG: WhiB family transcriptional regulator [Acidimicrobiia bacterium]